MRRLLSISLLLLFVLPLVSPLLAAAPSESNLPACCRRNGKHHCAMAGQLQSSGASPAASAPVLRERCPCALTAQAPSHLTYTPRQQTAAIYAGLANHPACHAQTEARLRISFDRSRQKRGPPALLPSLS